jgi:hypothetical protein
VTGWRIAVAVVLMAHGVGHALGVVPAFVPITDSWNTRSALLSGPLGERRARVVGIVLWSACMVGFVASGLALLGAGLPVAWWEPLAVASSVLSLLTLALFWHGFPTLVPNKVGAIAVDLTAIVGIVFAGWPGDALLGL